ncbi:ABC transporter ATP-binding protein [Enterococcus timonensis]|uniref:ABC transporter ATP-binding protein n=1 Tax=Enterococcus timonensis TaxID=1852364 RepID=UPI00131A01FD|nr:ABC transporter ATP-binding protein [Enterococcus timonensis]
MRKSKDLQGLIAFEDSKFYDDLQLISSEASWRPVNLIVFGMNIFRNAITTISMTILLGQYNLGLALLIAASLIPQAIISYHIQQDAFETMVTRSPDARKMQYYSDVLLTKTAAKEVRLFQLFDFFIRKYQNLFKVVHRDISQKRVQKMWVSLVFMIFSSGVSIYSLAWFVSEIQEGNLAIGALLVFTSAIVSLNQTITTIVQESSLLYDTLLYMQKYFAFMDYQDFLSETNQPLKLTNQSQITFENVTFSYPGTEREVLKNISFSIKDGEKIAVVGENGSGKSTLIKLFLRFYNLKSGAIFLNGTEISQYDLQEYRENISAVFQDFAHFSLTVFENVALAQIDDFQNTVKVQEAVNKAGFDLVMEQNKISFQDLLGKEFANGLELSGGQWQKLAIARAYFSKANILILDEPTAALDPRSESEIYQSFLDLANFKTVLFVTHRLAAVKKADRIIVLKNGEIIGFDSHQKLMEENAYYREFYNLQAKSYQE